MTIQVGYCTNVHAGADLETMRANLARHATAVRRQLDAEMSLPVGLWISAKSAKELLSGNELEPFGQWLASNRLLPYTLNGFPYGDFHQRVVKHDVYLPTWQDTERVEFTLDLIEILHRLLPDHAQGTISTLPLQWGLPRPAQDDLSICAQNLRAIASRLSQLESETGRRICVCLEPEPGCVLSTSRDLVAFFKQHLLADGDERILRRYIQVCHDVCHGVVMFERQQDVLRRFAEEGIGVGKVQISSAVVVPWSEIAVEDRAAAFEQLKGFAEDRYLHQVVVSDGQGNQEFHEDLPQLLANVNDLSSIRQQWRIHFHIPVYLERFGYLHASRSAIVDCVQAMRDYHPETTHYEVETYAWGVLPQELQQQSLSAGIAEEIRWFRQLVQE